MLKILSVIIIKDNIKNDSENNKDNVKDNVNNINEDIRS